jgi:hypothetical protein
MGAIQRSINLTSLQPIRFITGNGAKKKIKLSGSSRVNTKKYAIMILTI